MKKVFSLIGLFFLSSCAQMNDYIADANRQAILNLTCDQVAVILNKENSWSKTCSSEDLNVPNKVLINAFMEAQEKDLCQATLLLHGLYNHYVAEQGKYYAGHLEPLAPSVATKRSIECSKHHTKMATDIVAGYAIEPLCMAWYNRRAHPSIIAASDQLVQSKKIDCVAVVNGIKNEAAITQQTQEMKKQSQILRSIGADIDRSRTCTPSYGGTITCY